MHRCAHSCGQPHGFCYRSSSNELLHVLCTHGLQHTQIRTKRRFIKRLSLSLSLSQQRFTVVAHNKQFHARYACTNVPTHVIGRTAFVIALVPMNCFMCFTLSGRSKHTFAPSNNLSRGSVSLPLCHNSNSQWLPAIHNSCLWCENTLGIRGRFTPAKHAGGREFSTT